jgi:hypothetical protein
MNLTSRRDERSCHDVRGPAACLLQHKALGDQGDWDLSSNWVSAVGTAPRRTRTYNPLIKSQQSESCNVQLRNDLGTETMPAGHLLATYTCQVDSDLITIVDAWSTLPEALKAGIVAMVKAAKPEEFDFMAFDSSS